MILDYKRNIKILVDYEIGEEILIKDWGYKLNGLHTIEDIKLSISRCESGIIVKISGYEHYLDIEWIHKKPIK